MKISETEVAQLKELVYASLLSISDGDKLAAEYWLLKIRLTLNGCIDRGRAADCAVDIGWQSASDN